MARVHCVEEAADGGCDGLVHADFDVGGRQPASVLFVWANRGLHLVVGDVPAAHGGVPASSLSGHFFLTAAEGYGARILGLAHGCVEGGV